MTYCIGIKLKAGLVMLSDSRTNAGVDQIGTFRKMAVYEKPGNRVLTILSAGNLAISQSVRHRLLAAGGEHSLWTATNMFEVAELVGDAIRATAKAEAEVLKMAGVDFNISLLVGGQIAGEEPRLFNIYAAGNFIEATDENCYFQIGEAKYGKPIIDRVVTPETSLDEAAKCALISMDSTLKSNLSVGLPLDLLVYKTDSLAVTNISHIDDKNTYFQMIRNTWGQRLKQVFLEIEAPVWSVRDEQLKFYKPLHDTSAEPGTDNSPSLKQVSLSA